MIVAFPGYLHMFMSCSCSTCLLSVLGKAVLRDCDLFLGNFVNDFGGRATYCMLSFNPIMTNTYTLLFDLMTLDRFSGGADIILSLEG